MPALATPITPSRDDEVIEVLPAVSGDRALERRERKQLTVEPKNAQLALAVARRELQQARRQGDPRYAGLALAVLQAWTDDATAPNDIVLMKATLQQYLHDFEPAAARIEALLKRAGPRPLPQAWLTLATIRRVQGRYGASDLACQELSRLAALHGAACLAENAALRGHWDQARSSVMELLGEPGLPAATQAWLMTTLAELEQRAGRAPAADAAFRKVLALDDDPYAIVDYADFLIDERRYDEALALLARQQRTDVVLLRLAIAGTLAHAPSAARDAAEMRERIALANERPDARIFHGREQAMFALSVEHDPLRALELARGDVAHQREPLDIVVFARAARASGQAAALNEARSLVAEMGLHDQRIAFLAPAKP